MNKAQEVEKLLWAARKTLIEVRSSDEAVVDQTVDAYSLIDRALVAVKALGWALDREAIYIARAIHADHPFMREEAAQRTESLLEVSPRELEA